MHVIKDKLDHFEEKCAKTSQIFLLKRSNPDPVRLFRIRSSQIRIRYDYFESDLAKKFMIRSDSNRSGSGSPTIGRNPATGHQYLIAEIVVHLDKRGALPSHFLQLLLHTFQLSAQLVRLLSATQVKMYLVQIFIDCLAPEMEFLNGIFSRVEFLCGFLPRFFRSTKCYP
jgi:hypothetical protein